MFFSVDWENFENINLAIDIGEMKTSDVPFIPDVVFGLRLIARLIQFPLAQLIEQIVLSLKANYAKNKMRSG